MANSKFEYVRQFESHDVLLPQTYIVVRVDGKKFHEFSKFYDFDKPNDIRALKLMNASAKNVVLKYKSDMILAFGESDEYSFILRKDSVLFNRRSDKLATLFGSLFTSNYVALWPKFFTDRPLDLKHLPYFDARCVLYPSLPIVKDYLSWRFVDTHINNLYNTAFWQLVLKCGMTAQESENRLSGTVSSEKQEILFTDCGINYNNEPEIFKKGSLITKKGDIIHVDVIKEIDQLFEGC
ncbi:similar to Saccharomyces cerevisiae YGR024C THG1 tRNAHis guanylyltransferase, adds a guanosine residue to the 5' end of tRNAHis after transcription and RNase P cleavage [Maudiozyma barnettii]|uniref:tRNA(His) guanylyltransferase n=1 Tax=Maudiozyma barnettii TaxID=61262 RepID=A0A8H2ZJQ2_9SACH|nr:similar to Saccharomyces cerevisiae YGR024C THG1 tRNAHis guanylyltransferase, adds a guanosine residue to the 5' end of tRNAHis after transcription and RNase P cleavage [Kazachstania barnettii]CAB4256772.1 similar to Saccharomyces cerevisiae YGR024C THG1 tRNAHis guanylyltransferase, adds a guanosine residue to the 5' end of tRNAHis after transcription and RNase P cleavage [Kazachstania barnettii]CAD1785425.1 similar to Saccharomyces cerevisiae YGR024C THG1 tRNAHis guanylyltransferase, adds a g